MTESNLNAVSELLKAADNDGALRTAMVEAVSNAESAADKAQDTIVSNLK